MSRDAQPCPACDGRGLFDGDPFPVVCQTCNGEARVPWKVAREAELEEALRERGLDF